MLKPRLPFGRRGFSVIIRELSYLPLPIARFASHPLLSPTTANCVSSPTLRPNGRKLRTLTHIALLRLQATHIASFPSSNGRKLRTSSCFFLCRWQTTRFESALWPSWANGRANSVVCRFSLVSVRQTTHFALYWSPLVVNYAICLVFLALPIAGYAECAFPLAANRKLRRLRCFPLLPIANYALCPVSPHCREQTTRFASAFRP